MQNSGGFSTSVLRVQADDKPVHEDQKRKPAPRTGWRDPTTTPIEAPYKYGHTNRMVRRVAAPQPRGRAQLDLEQAPPAPAAADRAEWKLNHGRILAKRSPSTASDAEESISMTGKKGHKQHFKASWLPPGITKVAILGNPSQRPEALQVVVENIPAELKALPQWVTWRFVWDPKKRKWGKPPFNARTNGPANVCDPEHWATFDEALAAYGAGPADGIGIILAGIVGIDLDDCRDWDTGLVVEEAQAIITAMDTYCEVSPSGTGVKLLAHGELPRGHRRRNQIEMYDASRYFTITGHLLEGCPALVNERQKQLETLHRQIFGSLPALSRLTSLSSPILDGSAPILDDADLIDKAMNAKKGPKFKRLWAGDASDYGNDTSAADLALCNMLAFWCARDAARIDRLFRQSGLMRPKWDERRGARTYGALTIAKALEAHTNSYSASHGQRDGDERPHLSATKRQHLPKMRKKIPPLWKMLLASPRFMRTLPKSAKEKHVKAQLFKLARVIKDVMADACLDDLEVVARKWARSARSVLGKVDWVEVRAKLAYGIKRVKFPDRVGWNRCVKKAKTMPLPIGWEGKAGMLLNICCCLAEHRGPDKPFPLPLELIMEDLGVSQGKASQLRKDLEDDGEITLVNEYVPHVLAAEYILG